MYLIGCRDVEEFQDCLIEFKVDYSPENIKWLINPKTKFSIYSKRGKEDPFHFHPLSITTFLLPDRKTYDLASVMFRKVFEDGLRILVLAMAILCIRGQFSYSERQGHSTGYISLVTIGLHILDFSISLITGDEVFLEWKELASVKKDIYQFQGIQLFQALHYCINILLLFAFLEARYLLKRVLNSRQVEKSSRVKKLLNLRNPSDKLVFLISLLIHLIGFFIFYTLRKTYELPLLSESDNYEFNTVNDKRQQKWRNELGIYGGIVHDFFLLPQIIGNTLWGVQGKPLRKLYYIGYTMIRLVIRAYDCARDPVSYSENEFQYLRVESCYKLGNLIISAIVVTLAVTVYIQQKNGNLKVMRGRKLKECVNLDSKPEYSYGRLLSE